MSSIFNDPEWEQQRKEILSDWARRDGEVKVDMGETEEYMPAEEFLALRQKYPNGNMRLSEPQEAVKVFKDKGLPLPAESRGKFSRSDRRRVAVRGAAVRAQVRVQRLPSRGMLPTE